MTSAYPGAPDSPAVTVVVVTWQGRHLLADCLDALAGQDYPGPVEVVVVDNASTDGTAGWVRSERPDVRLLSAPRNLGFAGGNDLALGQVSTPVVALLNNDARPEQDWLRLLVAALLRPEAERVAAVTSLLLLPDGRVNSTGGVVYRDGYGSDRSLGEPADVVDDPAEVFAFCGAAVALRAEALREVGCFDESFFLYYEDADLSWRMRLAGWEVRYEPGAVVHHLHGASSTVGSPLFRFHNERNRLLMLTKNAGASIVLTQLARFVVTTGSLARRDLAARHSPWPGLRFRLGVLASYLRLLPHTWRERRRIAHSARVPRERVEELLLPVEHRPAAHGGRAEVA